MGLEKPSSNNHFQGLGRTASAANAQLGVFEDVLSITGKGVLISVSQAGTSVVNSTYGYILVIVDGVVIADGFPLSSGYSAGIVPGTLPFNVEFKSSLVIKHMSSGGGVRTNVSYILK